jgi:hypothetical protein
VNVSSLSRTSRYVLGSILVISALVRVILCVSGGQAYWPDEQRDNPDRILQAVIEGDYREIFSGFDDPHRPVFTALAVVPAAISRATGHGPIVETLFFSMASVISIWLLAGVARELGADEVESVLAAGLLAISTSFLYWSRHVQSYDLAMMFALVALLVGIQRGPAVGRLYLSGVVGGLAFLAYPGYWTTIAAVALLCVMRRSTRWRDGIANNLVAGAGVLTLPGLAIAISLLSGGQMLERFVMYSRIIEEGRFQEGWSLPFEYLWHTEHLLLVLWLAAVLWAVTRSNRSARVAAGLFASSLIYTLLVIFSVGLSKFVVYGRLARQVVPFLCLVAAAAVSSLWHSPDTRIRFAAFAIVGAVVIQAAANFWQPLVQSFPVDFIARNRPDSRVAAHYQRLIWLNTKHLFPGPEPVTLPPHYVTLAAARHPLEFLPYQYEGYTPERRAVLRSADTRMQLIGVLP